MSSDLLTNTSLGLRLWSLLVCGGTPVLSKIKGTATISSSLEPKTTDKFIAHKNHFSIPKWTDYGGLPDIQKKYKNPSYTLLNTLHFMLQ